LLTAAGETWRHFKPYDMKHTAAFVLLFLVFGFFASGFMVGKLDGYNDQPSLPGHVHSGGV